MNIDICLNQDRLIKGITNALNFGFSFYAYRLPDDIDVHFGASPSYLSGINSGAFVISPFDNNPDGIVSIEADYNADTLSSCSEEKKSTQIEPLYPFPLHSTSRKEHESQIRIIKDTLALHSGGKIIASRAILIEKDNDDIAGIYCRLLDSYPHAFCFIFFTPVSGLWAGASPELLLKMNSEKVSTISLAGTRVAGSETNWDNKNLEEQKIVTDYITNKFIEFEITPEVSPLFTKNAGPVEHLCNEIKGNLQPEDKASKLSFLKEFLRSYSPTPALCGLPKDVAFEVIKSTENHSRGYYGGYCGPVDCDGITELHVNLRSFRVEDKYCLFCGGGITTDSDAAFEWIETENKSLTLRNILSR